MTAREARRIANDLSLGQAKILAGFVSKPWPHHSGSLQDWQALELLGLVNGFHVTSRGKAVGKAALRLFDSVSRDPNRHKPSGSEELAQVRIPN